MVSPIWWVPTLAALTPSPAAVVIDFETYPDGTPACEQCPLTDQYAALGVVFGFRSWQTEATHAHLVESTAYDPPDLGVNHSVTAALTDTGFHPGILEVTLPRGPTVVEFRVRGSDAVERFAITGYAEDEEELSAPSIRREVVRSYTSSGGGRFREEAVRLTAETGIARVVLDGYGPPGHILLVDDLRLSAFSGDSAPPHSGS